MGAITEAIVVEIRERHARHPGRPDRELLEHLLVAVQRERVAAVGYDTARLGERLARSPLPSAARRAIDRVVGQIWSDESMHARYVLGVLLRQPGLAVQLGAMAEHAEGGVGGWMTAVEQHSRWGDAPTERLTAALIEAGGRLSGRIPVEVRSSLALGPLRQWCLFSADAEESAVLSFHRMIELAAAVEAQPDPVELGLPPGFSQELARMARDEQAHQRLFEIIAAHLDDADDLAPGQTEAGLIAALDAVDGWTADAGMQGKHGGGFVANPVCRGGLVAVARGEGPDDKLATFDRALADAQFFELLDRRAEALGKSRAQVSVVIKLDLLLAYRRDDRSTYVDPALVEALVERLTARGYRDITLCDARNIYSRYYANRTIDFVASYVGLRPGPARLVDLADEQVPHSFGRGMGVYTIGQSWRDADARISFAKLKTHPIAGGQLTLRNTCTVVPQDGEYFFADRLADFSSLLVAVLHDFPPHFGLIDGYSQAADGLVGMMADPTPKDPRVIVAGADVASVDLVAFHLMGERDPARLADVKAALRQFGDPRPHGEVLGDITPLADWDRADAGLLAAPLAALASPIYASFSRDGALFTADLDPDAFPPIGESVSLAVARKALRALLGIHR